MRVPIRLAWTIAALVAGVVFGARPSSAVAEPGDDLTVTVLTFGPGDHPFFKFGHNAILVQQRRSPVAGALDAKLPAAASEDAPPGSLLENGPGFVYNFGTFAFDSPALIPKFLRGKFMYWLSVSEMEETLASYAAANRSILAQELELTGAQKLRLWQALRDNARPENREYLYDYFRDNCSTRVRDAVDRVVDGRVHAAGRQPTSTSFRFHALRMVADLWPEYVGLYLGLGRAADLPIDRWQEAFLPERLADLLRTVRVHEGAEGKSLVRSERVVFQARRPPKPAAPPNWAVYFLLIGLATGAGAALLGHAAVRRPIARIGLGLLSGLVGGVLGLPGLLMVFLWALTDHRVAHSNANIFQMAPWAIGMVWYGLGVARGKSRALTTARWLVAASLAFSLIGIVCKMLPGANQDNWPFVLFCLPLWGGMAEGLRRLSRRSA